MSASASSAKAVYTPNAAPYTPPMASQYTAHFDQTCTLQVQGTEINESMIVRTDAWESGLCSCCSSCVNCCMVFWLPCVSIAQISQRIGFAKYWHVLFTLLGLYFAELFVSQLFLSVSYRTVWYDYRYYDYDNYRRSDSWFSWSFASSYDTTYDYNDLDDTTYIFFIIGIVAGAIVSLCTYLGSLTGLVLIFMTWALRSRIRTNFNIPGSCCGDCFASLCCSCCAVAQMATHVKTYEKSNCNFGPVDTLPAFLPQ